MLKNTIALAIVLAALTAPALASDDDRYGSRDRYESRERYEHSFERGRCAVRSGAELLTVDQVAQKLKEQGYTVRRIETSHGCYEVKATDANGIRLEFYVDPATASVINRGRRS